VTVQHDFGGFDPSFVGVTIRFGSESAFRFSRAFRQGDRPPQVDHLTAEERFEALSIASVISHEVRHFHDFLISPYSARLFKLRVQGALNTLQMLPELQQFDGNCLPVPLSKWCAMSQAERDEALSRLPRRRDGDAWRPVPLPFVKDDQKLPRALAQYKGDDALEMLLGAARVNREGVRELTLGQAGSSRFQPWQVYEASALLVQLQELWSLYGKEEFEFFMDSLVSEENAYASMWKLIKELWDQHGQRLDTRIASATIFWSLLGSYLRDGTNGCPTVRFTRLLALLKKEGVPSSGSDLASLFRRWSARLKLSTIEDGLDEAVGVFARLSDIMRAAATTFPSELRDEFDALMRVTDGVEASSRHMVEQLRRDLDIYVAPHRYQENLEHFANPVLRRVYDGSALRVEKSFEDMEREGYLIEWAAESGGDKLIYSMTEPFTLSKFGFLRAKDTLHASHLFSITDFLFSRSARARPDVERAAREYLAQYSAVPVDLDVLF
jgi:hypothetical protein